jgi:ABC-type transporter Mla subunit MlaD
MSQTPPHPHVSRRGSDFPEGLNPNDFALRSSPSSGVSSVINWINKVFGDGAKIFGTINKHTDRFLDGYRSNTEAITNAAERLNRVQAALGNKPLIDPRKIEKMNKRLEAMEGTAQQQEDRLQAMIEAQAGVNNSQTIPPPTKEEEDAIRDSLGLPPGKTRKGRTEWVIVR